MAMLVYDDGYRWLLKTLFDYGIGKIPLKVEFCSGSDDAVYYSTEDVRGYHDNTLKIISLYAVCDVPKATRPCTHVIWRRVDNDDVIYKVLYNQPLPEMTAQICHILLSVDDAYPESENVGYIAVPTDMLVELIKPDIPGLLALEIKKSMKGTPNPQHVPVGEFFGYLIDCDISEDPVQLTYSNDIRVRLSDNRIGVLVFINDVPFLEIL